MLMQPVSPLYLCAPQRYDIKSNFFFEADATKMDYGGHDSRFTDNVIYVSDSDGQNCINNGVRT